MPRNYCITQIDHGSWCTGGRQYLLRPSVESGSRTARKKRDTGLICDKLCGKIVRSLHGPRVPAWVALVSIAAGRFVAALGSARGVCEYALLWLTIGVAERTELWKILDYEKCMYIWWWRE